MFFTIQVGMSTKVCQSRWHRRNCPQTSSSSKPRPSNKIPSQNPVVILRFKKLISRHLPATNKVLAIAVLLFEQKYCDKRRVSNKIWWREGWKTERQLPFHPSPNPHPLPRDSADLCCWWQHPWLWPWKMLAQLSIPSCALPSSWEESPLLCLGPQHKSLYSRPEPSLQQGARLSWTHRVKLV